jgi:hypothetical protein
VQPGPRIVLPRGRNCLPGEKNDCERTRNNRTAIHTTPAGRPDSHHERHSHPSPFGGGGRGALPPRPPEIYRSCAELGEKSRNGTQGASRLRSRPLSRRSGRVSALPCPPLRSLTILSALHSRNYRRCAPKGRKRPPVPAVHPSRRALQQGQIRFIGDVSGVEPTGLRALYAILGGRFFEHASFFQSDHPTGRIHARKRSAARFV